MAYNTGRNVIKIFYFVRHTTHTHLSRSASKICFDLFFPYPYIVNVIELQFEWETKKEFDIYFKHHLQTYTQYVQSLFRKSKVLLRKGMMSGRQGTKEGENEKSY